MLNNSEIHNLVNLTARLNSIVEIVRDEKEKTGTLSIDFKKTLIELSKTWEKIKINGLNTKKNWLKFD